MDRREFLKTAALAAAGTLLGGGFSGLRADDPASVPGDAATIRNYQPGMVYRPMGKTGVMVSPLGFGMMRLPTKPGGGIDEDLAGELLRYAIDRGLNYVDTAYVYTGGESERITGRILRDGYRDRVYIATKSPSFSIRAADDFERILDEQREKLQVDVIDFYLLHNITDSSWETVRRFDLIDKLLRAKADGKIRFAGFSFHARFPLFQEVVDASPDWDMCQIQMNYIDTGYQAGLAGLRYAAERNLGISIMEPLRGGFLADVPAEVAAIFSEASRQRTPVDWAFDYLWDMPEVGVALSGMNVKQHVVDNLDAAARSAPGMLSDEERAVLARAAAQFAAFKTVACTGCEYCLPCPLGVNIPRNLHLYNQYKMTGEIEPLRQEYLTRLAGQNAAECIQCGICEPLCPQSIKIPDVLEEMRAVF
ncbi:MAG: aldo/keto reductase [Planctomycetes bacterium]|nr:aldo/keto reductase [Planctomycetota bacterium]